MCINAADLLEVGKLCDFHAVEPYFPANPPGPKSRGFPVIFYETDIMFFRIDSQFLQTFQIGFLNIIWRWFHNNLELMMLE